MEYDGYLFCMEEMICFLIFLLEQNLYVDSYNNWDFIEYFTDIIKGKYLFYEHLL